LSPTQCSAKLLCVYWFKQGEFEEVFDDKQRFELLINRGWLEKKPTNSTKALYSKRDIYKALSNKYVRLPLHLQACEPCHIGGGVFLVANNWASNDT